MLYAQRAAVAINNAVEDKILSSYSSCLAANQITNGGSAITLTSTTAGTSVYDNLVLARENLSKQNVPPNQPRWVVVNPATASLLLKDTVHFIRSTDLGDKVAQMGTVDGLPARPGFLGMCAGFEVYESNGPHGQRRQVPRLRRRHYDCLRCPTSRGRADPACKTRRVGHPRSPCFTMSRCSPKPPSVSATSTPRDMNALCASNGTGVRVGLSFIFWSTEHVSSGDFRSRAGVQSPRRLFQERYDSVDFRSTTGRPARTRFPTRSAVG